MTRSAPISILILPLTTIATAIVVVLAFTTLTTLVMMTAWRPPQTLGCSESTREFSQLSCLQVEAVNLGVVGAGNQRCLAKPKSGPLRRAH
jgi:hypothetical protein